MKHLLLSLCAIIMALSSCTNDRFSETSITEVRSDTAIQIPNIMINKDSVQFDNAVSRWMQDTSLYSGYIESYYINGTIKEREGVWNGVKHGPSQKWYVDGHLKRIMHYHMGKLNGEKKQWSADSNHTLVANFQFKDGKVHGKQTKWYNTGELYQILHLNNGKEEGLQQAYRKNGVLYANYEVKNGRIFGLKKSSLCYGLKDENINYEN